MKVWQCSDGRLGKPGKPAGLPKINWEAPTNYDITLLFFDLQFVGKNVNLKKSILRKTKTQD